MLKQVRFEEIMDRDCMEAKKYDGNDDDKVFLGLQLMRKYLPKAGIEGADHDIVFSVDVDSMVEAGITEKDAIELWELGWFIQDGEYLAHYV